MIVAGGSGDRNLVRASRADSAPSEEEIKPVPVPDLAQVDFSAGPGGEPIELERPGSGSRFGPFESYFYRDRHGRLVRHGPYVQWGGGGRKMDEEVYIYGTRKFGQGWDSEGRPIRSEVYRGDGDHTRVDLAYWDDGGIKSIGRYRIRHAITEAGEKIEAIPHGLCVTYYDNTLVRSSGHLDQLAGVHQAELYEDGELVGIAVYSRSGELRTSRGRLGDFIKNHSR
jgi:hypothetical protein